MNKRRSPSKIPGRSKKIYVSATYGNNIYLSRQQVDNLVTFILYTLQMHPAPIEVQNDFKVIIDQLIKPFGTGKENDNSD